MIGHFLQKLHQGLDPARSMMNKGGGGGGSSTPYYYQQDRLFGTQADIAQNLYNQYAAMAPTFLGNTTDMVNDAMDGTLASQMRQRAGNDAAAANGASWGAMNRNMSRMGANFSTDRMLSEANKNSIMGAANMSGALNNATQAAEDMKWNRNAGAYSQIAGMGSGAMQGMGSAAAGYGNMANSMSINQMANAQGFGKFGSSIAGIGMGYADGGEVKPGLKLATGSYVRTPFVNKLAPVDWRSMPTSGPGYTGTSTGDALSMMAMGMIPGLGMLAAKDLMKGDKSTIGNWYSKLTKSDDTKPDVVVAPAVVDTPVRSLAFKPEGELPGFKVDPLAVQADTMPLPTTDSAVNSGSFDFINNIFGGSKYACGGPVKRGLRMASGGYAQTFDGDYETDPDRFKRKAPSQSDMAVQRLGNSAMGAATNPMTYVNAYKNIDKLNTASQAQEGLADAQSAYDATLAAQPAADVAGTVADASSGTADTINAAVDLANAGEAADAASKAADGVGGGNPVTSVVKGIADIASGRDAGEAVADAALGYGGAELGAAIGTAAGPVGTVVGGLLGGLLGGSIFKDGGKVSKPGLRQGRKNLKPGGKVQGPGTETSDDIPAWLSDGEYVLNADAVKMVGKDKLDAINERGLAARRGKPKAEVGLAMGGRVKKGC